MTHKPDNQDQVFDLASILNILWRRRLIVLGLPALGLIVGLAYGVFAVGVAIASGLLVGFLFGSTRKKG